MKDLRFVILIVALVACASAVCAAPAYYEGFDYVPGEDPASYYMPPAGGWLPAASNYNGWIATAPGATYTDQTGSKLVVSGNMAYQELNGLQTYIYHELPQEAIDLFATEGTFYITMLAKEAHTIQFKDPYSNIYVGFDLYPRSTDHYQGALYCQNGTDFHGELATAQYWFGVQWDLYAIRVINHADSGVPDEVTFLRNPSLTNPNWGDTGPYSSRVNTIDITSIDYDRLVMWGGGGTNVAWPNGEWVGGVDEIRVARDWADAAPVVVVPPDPTTVFYEGFDYAANATVGPEGNWTTIGGYNPYTIQATGAIYADASGNALNVTGKSAYQTVANDKYNYVTKSIPPKVGELFATDGTFYITMLFREQNGIAFKTTSSGKYIDVGTYPQTEDWYYAQAELPGATATRSATWWLGTQYDLYAIKVVNNAAPGALDQVTMIRNPDLSNPVWDNANPETTYIEGDITASDYTYFNVWGGGQSSSLAGGVEWYRLDWIGGMDEIRIARDWADAAPYTPGAPVSEVGGNMKDKADNDPVNCWGIVTAEWLGYFYIESTDRSVGIRVEKTAYHANVGRKATVLGTIQTLPSGERYIACEAVNEVTDTALKPLGMTNKSLGGGDIAGQDGIVDGVGLNNIGLLVTVWGKVSGVSSTILTLDDGSGVSLKAYAPMGGFPYTDGEYVAITGISSCEKVGTDIKRVLLAP